MVESDAKHDEHEDGEYEAIAGDPLEETIVLSIAAGDLLQNKADDAERLLDEKEEEEEEVVVVELIWAIIKSISNRCDT